MAEKYLGYKITINGYYALPDNSDGKHKMFTTVVCGGKLNIYPQNGG